MKVLKPLDMLPLTAFTLGGAGVFLLMMDSAFGVYSLLASSVLILSGSFAYRSMSNASRSIHHMSSLVTIGVGVAVLSFQTLMPMLGQASAALSIAFLLSAALYISRQPAVSPLTTSPLVSSGIVVPALSLFEFATPVVTLGWMVLAMGFMAIDIDKSKLPAPPKSEVDLDNVPMLEIDED